MASNGAPTDSFEHPSKAKQTQTRTDDPSKAQIPDPASQTVLTEGESPSQERQVRASSDASASMELKSELECVDQASKENPMQVFASGMLNTIGRSLSGIFKTKKTDTTSDATPMTLPVSDQSTQPVSTEGKSSERPVIASDDHPTEMSKSKDFELSSEMELSQSTPTDNSNEAPPITTNDPAPQPVLKEKESPSYQGPVIASNGNPIASTCSELKLFEQSSKVEPTQTTSTDNPNEASPMTTTDPAPQPVFTEEESPSSQGPVIASNNTSFEASAKTDFKSNLEYANQTSKREPTQTTPTDNPNEASPMTTTDSASKLEPTEEESPSSKGPVIAFDGNPTVSPASSDSKLCEQSSKVEPTQARNTDNLNEDPPLKEPVSSQQQISQEDSSTKTDLEYVSTHDYNVFKTPQCLISTREDKVLEVCGKVLDEISRIDKPCVVVAIAGLYRTGKSYLMNRLAKAESGFALGDTIESKTKGIWVWCRDHPEQKDTVLMLLDTEGLGDAEKGDANHDNHIFTLATLLCGTLVYNMKGAFDQDAVNKLTFVSEVSRNIKFGGRCGEGNSLLQCVLPGFVLALRDFSLRLIKGGRQITSDEYLEEYLESNTRKDVSFNKPRECIRKFFPQDKRRCFAFPTPGDSETLEKLESLTFEELSPRFKTVTTLFVSYIYSQEPKQLQVSKPINGPMFVTLTRNYVDAFARGSVPDVDDTFAMVAKIENQRVKNECMHMFHSKMKELLLPLPSKLLDKHFTDARWSALEYMRTNTIKDIANAVERDAQMEMDLFQQQCQRANEEKIEEHCRNILDGMESLCKLKAGSENKEYEVLGGHRIFKRDVDNVRKEYEQALLRYEQREIGLVWSSFANELSSVEDYILDKDNELSQEEKRREKEEIANAMEQMRVEMAEDNQKALERQKKDIDEQQLKLNAERERRDKEQEDKLTGFQNRIAALETNTEDQQKLLEQIQALREKDRREHEEKTIELEDMYIRERKKRTEENAKHQEKLRIEKEQREGLEKKERERKDKFVSTRIWDAFWNY
ncbi:guanylate-binding protein 1-like [Mya arenaria]|uniref:guanylate-binding protein 1-like n=1 Tax=Mya arenaria TaxID=6604 RepID=UPI0022E08303|nr:guanylate-binding protein 1-like [Mya arenaria]